MKSLKLVMLGAAGALLLAINSAQAQTFSDTLTLFGPTGVVLGQTTATEAQEAANPTLPLFSFDHNLSNVAFMGHYVEIIDPLTGNISDVVGVDNEGNPVNPNHMAFISTDAAGGVTPGMLALAGFTTLDATFISTEPETMDSRGVTPWDLALRNYIGTSNPAGSYLVFASTAPDGGSAVALLGMALVGIEGLRRKIGARKA